MDNVSCARVTSRIYERRQFVRNRSGKTIFQAFSRVNDAKTYSSYASKRFYWEKTHTHVLFNVVYILNNLSIYFFETKSAQEVDGESFWSQNRSLWPVWQPNAEGCHHDFFRRLQVGSPTNRYQGINFWKYYSFLLSIRNTARFVEKSTSLGKRSEETTIWIFQVFTDKSPPMKNGFNKCVVLPTHFSIIQNFNICWTF